MLTIGVDFGGVLAVTTTPPPGPGDAYLSIRPRANARSVIQGWRESGHIPYMISKADSAEKQAKAMNWLNKYGFDELFGLSNLLFCEDQAGKLALCHDHGVEAMIDDNAFQLRLVAPAVPLLLLFDAVNAPDGMVAVQDWLQVASVIAQVAL